MPVTLKSSGGGSVTMDVPSTASTYTLTLPAVTGTVLQTGTTVTVAQGGTGLATLTANNVLLGNGTGTPNFVAPGTSGNVLVSNGTTWTSAAPATPASGQVQFQIFTYTGSAQTWTAPTGVTKVKAVVIGGGGGANASSGHNGGSGGGASGIYTVTPGTGYTITIGAGGAGAVGTGTAGGTTSFAAFCSATGGAGATGNDGNPGTGSGGNIRNSAGTFIENQYYPPIPPFWGAPQYGFNSNISNTNPYVWGVSSAPAPGAGGANSSVTTFALGGWSGAVYLEWVG